MILCTGDIHGSLRRIRRLDKRISLDENDYVIVAGDFGMTWTEEYTEWLNRYCKSIDFTILFVDGNHENYSSLYSYPVSSYCGGSVRKLNEHCYQLMRGEVYTIQGKTIFTFGGARSVDKESRVVGESWWMQEMPTLEEISHGRENLMANLDKINYVITHDCPYSMIVKLTSFYFEDEKYPLRGFFDEALSELVDKPNFKKWIFGHMHVDEDFGKIIGMYEDFIELK